MKKTLTIDLDQEVGEKIKFLQRKLNNAEKKILRLETKQRNNVELLKFSKDNRDRLNTAALNMIEALQDIYWEEFGF